MLEIGIVLILFTAGATGVFLYNHYLGEQARRPYRDAGLSDEQAEEFIAKYPKQNGNSTWVSFAKSWANDRALAEESLKTFGNLKDSLDYLYFANSNEYDGLNFLKDFSQFAKNYEEVLPAYSANSSLVKIVYDQFQRDPRINLDRNELFLEALKIYQNLGREVQKFSQIYALNNATSYFGSYSKLINEIGNDSLSASVRKLGENDGVNKDFDNARKHANMLRLAKHVENILKYPKEWREGAIQVDDVGYGTGMASQDEAKFWSVVEKAVKYVVDKLDSGEAEYDLNIPDGKIEAWYRRQRLLPIDLFEIDIVSGWHNIINGKITPSLEIGWRNVSPDSSIDGKTPQQWLDEMSKKDFREKTLRYLLAIDEVVRGHPAYGEWPNSDAAYKKLFGNTVEKDHIIVSFDGLMKEDEVAVFIQGYPRALSRGFIPWRLEAVVPMEGQTCPYYSVLIARVFGRAALVLTDKYPNSGGYHSEPYVIISPQLHEKISQYGKTTLPYMFGWWQYAEPLIKDHVEGKYALELQLTRPDGKWERINP